MLSHFSQMMLIIYTLSHNTFPLTDMLQVATPVMSGDMGTSAESLVTT